MSTPRPVLLVLLPPLRLPLELFPPVAEAAEHAAFAQERARESRPGGGAVGSLADVSVVLDAGAGGPPGGCEVVELLSSGPPVAMRIPCASPLPFLVLHLCDVGRHVSVEVACRDSRGALRRVTASTRGVSVRATPTTVSLPVVLGSGWHLVRLDLADILHRSFGSQFASAELVTISASCRVARIYFEARPLDNGELPEWLRV